MGYLHSVGLSPSEEVLDSNSIKAKNLHGKESDQTIAFQIKMENILSWTEGKVVASY